MHQFVIIVAKSIQNLHSSPESPGSSYSPEIFLGLDLSLTSSGVVIIDSNYTILYKNTFSVDFYGVQRLFFLEEKLCKIFIDFPNILLTCIESPAYRDSGKLFELGEWAGITKLNLFKNGVPFVLAAPLQLKKYVSGKGKNNGKETVLLDIYKNFGEEIRQDDIGDAYVLARIARDFYYYIKLKSFQGTSYQKEVLDMIKKSMNINLLGKII